MGAFSRADSPSYGEWLGSAHGQRVIALIALISLATLRTHLSLLYPLIHVLPLLLTTRHRLAVASSFVVLVTESMRE